MINVLIIDDHAIVRRGLYNLIADEFAGVRISESGTGQAALQAVQQKRWDIAILDINLPDKNGLEVAKEIKQHQPDLQIVILSLYPEQQYALRAFKAGASGYLTKESAPEELISAMKKVLAGGKYVSASLAEELATHLSDKDKGPGIHKLSNRELEVLCLIARGKTSSEIARHLSLSEKTISTYRSRVLGKLRLNSTPELIRYALVQNLVD